MEYHKHLKAIAVHDLDVVVEKDKEYGASWQKRGGTSAFHIMFRKADRIEVQAAAHGYDIFEAIRSDPRPEGILDDIQDLRRYLDLIEAYAIEKGWAPNPISGMKNKSKPVQGTAATVEQANPRGYDEDEYADTDVRAGDGLATPGDDAEPIGRLTGGDRSGDKG
jgi:hypothetical protein